MAGIALFFPIKIIVALDSAYFKTYKTSSNLCVSMPFIAKDIAIIRRLVTGGGRHELSQEMFGQKN